MTRRSHKPRTGVSLTCASCSHALWSGVEVVGQREADRAASNAGVWTSPGGVPVTLALAGKRLAVWVDALAEQTHHRGEASGLVSTWTPQHGRWSVECPRCHAVHEGRTDELVRLVRQSDPRASVALTSFCRATRVPQSAPPAD